MVLRLRPVWVRVVRFGATVTVLRPLVNVALVARWMVKPVTSVTLAQDRITVRLLPFPFGPLIAVKDDGAAGATGTATVAVFE